MEPGSGLPQRRAGGGGLDLGAGSAAGSPALSGGQSRRRKQPPRPADFKLQVIIIGSRGVGKTSLMERFTDDTFCEACKSTVGKGASPVPGEGALLPPVSANPAMGTRGSVRRPPFPCPCPAFPQARARSPPARHSLPDLSLLWDARWSPSSSPSRPGLRLGSLRVGFSAAGILGV